MHGNWPGRFPEGARMSLSMTSSELYAVLGLPDAPTIIDVRRPAAYDQSPHILPSARRGIPDQVSTWARDLPKSRPLAVYCVHGHEVSQGAADTLNALGFSARYLE